MGLTNNRALRFAQFVGVVASFSASCRGISVEEEIPIFIAFLADSWAALDVV